MIILHIRYLFCFQSFPFLNSFFVCLFQHRLGNCSVLVKYLTPLNTTNQKKKISEWLSNNVKSLPPFLIRPPHFTSVKAQNRSYYHFCFNGEILNFLPVNEVFQIHYSAAFPSVSQFLFQSYKSDYVKFVYSCSFPNFHSGARPPGKNSTITPAKVYQNTYNFVSFKLS